jgi:hypothetical protein
MPIAKLFRVFVLVVVDQDTWYDDTSTIRLLLDEDMLRGDFGIRFNWAVPWKEVQCKWVRARGPRRTGRESRGESTVGVEAALFTVVNDDRRTTTPSRTQV